MALEGGAVSYERGTPVSGQGSGVSVQGKGGQKPFSTRQSRSTLLRGSLTPEPGTLNPERSALKTCIRGEFNLQLYGNEVYHTNS